MVIFKNCGISEQRYLRMEVFMKGGISEQWYFRMKVFQNGGILEWSYLRIYRVDHQRRPTREPPGSPHVGSFLHSRQNDLVFQFQIRKVIGDGGSLQIHNN